jgi:hypothetical protein
MWKPSPSRLPQRTDGSCKPVIGGAIFAMLAITPVRALLEASMPGHMLIQIPLLILAGFLFGSAIASRLHSTIERFDPHGIALVLVSVFAFGYWMLPRSLDAALATPGMELVKFLSLPLLVGLPVGICWSLLSTVTRGFTLANGIAMLGVLGWLYLVAPVRLCNYYLASEQIRVGQGLLLLATLVGVIWLGRACFARSHPLRAIE